MTWKTVHDILSEKASYNTASIVLSHIYKIIIYIYIYTQKIGIMLPEHTEILSFALNGELKAYLFLCAFL